MFNSGNPHFEDVRSLDDGTKVVVRKSEAATAKHIDSALSVLDPAPTDPNMLRCFFTMLMKFGEGDRGEEGYIEVEVSSTYAV